VFGADYVESIAKFQAILSEVFVKQTVLWRKLLHFLYTVHTKLICLNNLCIDTIEFIGDIYNFHDLFASEAANFLYLCTNPYSLT